jgi:hypothetical protein
MFIITVISLKSKINEDSTNYGVDSTCIFYGRGSSSV